MKKVFIYWDNSNIFHSVQSLAEDRGAGPDAHNRVRISFDNTYRLAHAGREVERAYVAGSIPPETQKLWKQLENKGIKVELFDRVERRGRSEQEVPDTMLQLRMLEDALDFEGCPGIAVLLTGDAGFLPHLQRMHRAGWSIELFAWKHSCGHQMREWASANGKFTALDDSYDEITYMKNS